MIIQATVPTAFGLLFTPWLLDQSLVLGAVITTLAVGAMFLTFQAGLISRTMLAMMALFYVAFAGCSPCFTWVEQRSLAFTVLPLLMQLAD